MKSAECGHTDIVRMLLAHPGVDVNLQDKVGMIKFYNFLFYIKGVTNI